MPSQNRKLGLARLEQIIEFAETLSQQNNFQEILRLVAQRVSQLLNAEVALILMLNPRTQKTVKTIIKEGLEVNQPGYQSIQNQVSGWIMRTKEPLLTTDITKDPRFRKVSWDDFPVKSVVGVPLRADGAVIGALILLNKSMENEFDEFDLTFLSKLAVFAVPYLRNVQKIQEYFEAPLPEPALLSKYEPAGLLGSSQRFIELLQAIEAAARCDVRVLLQGASGTGKELVARAIHENSARSAQPFVAVDCGAIPGHLLESELFGFVKGAFTGATADRKGLFQEADKGALFLDEIANLPLEMQSKLMRVLQEGEVRPLGSNKAHKIDVRIISASISSIKALVQEKKFREDLYYRIYVYPIYIPSLKDRCEDIPTLTNHFIRKFAAQQNKQVAGLNPYMMDFMTDRNWDGNIRELENFVERLITLAPQDKKTLDREILPEDIKDEMRREKFVYDKSKTTRLLSEKLAGYEKELLRAALKEHKWNQSRAARALQIPVQTLRYKMSKLRIEKEDS